MTPFLCLGAHLHVQEHRGQVKGKEVSRCGDDDLCVDQFLVKLGIGALFIRSRDQGVTLVLDPFSDSQFVFCRP